LPGRAFGPHQLPAGVSGVFTLVKVPANVLACDPYAVEFPAGIVQLCQVPLHDIQNLGR